MPVSKRRIAKDGIRVLVCGFNVSSKHGLICMLPPKTILPHSTHVVLAISTQQNNDTQETENNLVLGFREAGGEVEWRAVGE